jgi:hypothetical protein
MKKQLFIIALIIFHMTANSQENESNDYLLKVSFLPSFVSSSDLIIYEGKKENLIVFSIDNYESIITISNSISDSNLKKIKSFLKTYEFKIKSNIDTTGFDTRIVDGDTIIDYHISMGNDGITVHGFETSNNNSRNFGFWSPKKETKNHEMIELLFNIMNKYFTEKRMVEYFEQLEGYFNFGLGLKKLKDDPLTYKIYGYISVWEEDEVEKFLNSLPTDQKVIIDLSNFNGMGAIYYPLFRKTIREVNSLYWYMPNEEGLKDLEEIGVLKEKILEQ